MFTIANASITLKMNDTQRKQTARCLSCDWCGLVHYLMSGVSWSCPVCPPRGLWAAADTCHGVGRVGAQAARLRFMKRGELRYKALDKWLCRPLKRGLWGRDAYEAIRKNPSDIASRLRVVRASLATGCDCWEQGLQQICCD